MIKRFVIVGVLMVFLVILLDSRDVKADYACAVFCSDCQDFEKCSIIFDSNCFPLKSCERLSCPWYYEANECTIDSHCGAGEYCAINDALGVYSTNHKCQTMFINMCRACAYPKGDCNANGGCESDLGVDWNNCGSCGNKCSTKPSYCSGGKLYDYTDPCSSGSCTVADTGYTDACCTALGVGTPNACNNGCKNLQTDLNNCGSCGNVCSGGYLCQSGSCVPRPRVCDDVDGDGYFSNAVDCGQPAAKQDCNDANAAVHPGAAEVCGNGVDEDCSGGDLVCGGCGDWIANGAEACDWGANNGVWTPSLVSCPGGYPNVAGQYRCKSDCSGFEYDTSNCGKCSDGVCNGPETKVTCAIDCDKCGNGVEDAGEVCDLGVFNGAWSADTVSCPGGYADVTGRSRCKGDCSGFEYDTSNCGRCGDRRCESPETKFSCAIDCLRCGNSIWEEGFGEGCDWGASNGGAWQFNSWVSCGAYPSVEKDSRCSTSCQWEYDVPSCGSCGDAVVNGPEQCEAGQTQQYTCLDGSKVLQSCDSTTCQWAAAGCPVAATCVDGVKNGDETGVDCGGSCTLAGVMEACNGVDDNKDCVVGWGEWDNDGDGLMGCAGDCDDADPFVQACPPPGACVGVELDSSAACCVGAGFQWVKSGEPNVGADEVDNQFQDNEGKRKASMGVRLLPNEYRCFGDDADEQFPLRTKQCRPGVCADDPLDKVLCDKSSDCVFNSRCYSDVKLVASTFFSSDLFGVWNSNWKGEVSVDVNGDGKVEVCDPGLWGGSGGVLSGMVSNVTGNPVEGVTVKVLGTGLSATTLADGSYSIASVPFGTYDIVASKSVDGYDDATSLDVNVVSGSVSVDFLLLLSLGSCTNDCTKAGSNFCDASCDGKGMCKFYSGEAKTACDGTFGIVGLSGGRQVSCCEGQPYSPIKADVTVNAKKIIKTVTPVVYKGKFVKLVTLLFIPQR